MQRNEEKKYQKEVWAETIWGHLGTFTFHAREMVEAKKSAIFEDQKTIRIEKAPFKSVSEFILEFSFYIFLIII